MQSPLPELSQTVSVRGRGILQAHEGVTSCPHTGKATSQNIRK